jgi:hypothetical protein
MVAPPTITLPFRLIPLVNGCDHVPALTGNVKVALLERVQRQARL